MTAAHGAAAPADSGRSLRFQAFVFNWPGEKQRARALEVHLAPHCPVVVVNSDAARRGEFPHWVHVGADAYFTRQWDEAVHRTHNHRVGAGRRQPQQQVVLDEAGQRRDER